LRVSLQYNLKVGIDIGEANCPFVNLFENNDLVANSKLVNFALSNSLIFLLSTPTIRNCYMSQIQFSVLFFDNASKLTRNYVKIDLNLVPAPRHTA